MLNDLFINALILISFTFIGGGILKELPKDTIDKLSGKVFIGICGGLLGILMIIYNINIEGTTTFLDLRILAMMMINYVGGNEAALIVGIIIGIFRITYYGVNQSSILAIIDIVLYIVILFVANKYIKVSWKNWFLKLLTATSVFIATLFYLLRNIENPNIVIYNYILVMILAGTLEFFLLEYVRRSNELFRRYKEGSTTDYLTGLNNTRSFDQLLNTTFEKARENKETLSCLMLDIDYFKKVNDTYGHAVGDIVLKELAAIITKSCRSFDIIGRVGGEEFCVLLLDCSKERSFEIGSRIKNAVKEHNFYISDNKFINITVSVGTATYPDTVGDLESIMKGADEALYIAKRTGRDRVCDNNKCFFE